MQEGDSIHQNIIWKDFSSLPTDEAIDKAAEYCKSQDKPINLRKDLPLCRVYLIKINSKTISAIEYFHHLMADAVTIQIFKSQLNELYLKFKNGLDVEKIVMKKSII